MRGEHWAQTQLVQLVPQKLFSPVQYPRSYRRLWIHLFVVLLLTISALYCYSIVLKTPTIGSISNPVSVQVFIEAHCEDSTVFMHNVLYPVYKELHSIMNLELFPYGKARTLYTNGTYQIHCQHGEPECLVNSYMACVLDKVEPISRTKAFIAIACAQGKMLNETQACSTLIGYSHRQLLSCVHGQGKALLRGHGELTNGLRPKLFRVPWVVVNGVPRDNIDDLRTIVCVLFVGSYERCDKP